jgi:lysozyme family protein
MADFKPACDLTLERHEVIAYGTSHEIDYCNVAGDAGGATKYGISQAAYPHLDIKNLTEDQARQIYEDDYWTPYHMGGIISQHVADFVFDLLVNMGPYHDFQIVQRAINALGNDLSVDGKNGPATMAAINAADPVALKAEIGRQAERWYEELNRPKFIASWLRRIKDDEANA